MLKFVKHHLETIDGVTIYPIISLCVFFLFFVILSLRVATLKKSYLQNISQLPLDQNNPDLP